MRELLDELKRLEQSKISNDYGIYQDKLEKASPVLIEALEIALRNITELMYQLGKREMSDTNILSQNTLAQIIRELNTLAREVGK